MKTEIDLETRKLIAELISFGKSRMYYNGYAGKCPFDQRCNLCGMLFPKWAESHGFDGERFPTGFTGYHPCWAYGEDYVLDRMKKLFPELY